MRIAVPEYCLVALVGVSGSGKSTFARKHFRQTEVLSSDYCRALVSDDENDMDATRDAFEVLNFIAAKRLAAGKLVVVDATNVQREARQPLVQLARKYHCVPVAVVFNLPENLCQERNCTRSDRQLGEHVIRQQAGQLRQSLRRLEREGFRHVYIMDTPEEVEAAEVERQPMRNNLEHEHGPFDIIGDVHGCYDELAALLEKLGYRVEQSPSGGSFAKHPLGRKAVFLGDLVDRGPGSPEVLRLVMGMVGTSGALCVPGNHETKLMRKLRGRDVQVTHGLAETLEQLEKEPPEFKREVADFIYSLLSHYVLDDGKLVVAHAGIKEEMQGRGSSQVRDFALYGETTGETDEFGLPVRYDWAADYRGKARVVYGHTPVPEPEWLNNTICIDTGCVFGGKLTALRYPELELVSVPAFRTYYAPARTFPTEPQPVVLSAQHQVEDLLDIDDFRGKRIVATGLRGNVTIREGNTAAALETMSRFGANPKWIIYLPPTMSPAATSQLPGFLEHPVETFSYFRGEGVSRVVCEEKHMGSRAVVIVCRDENAARRRFGLEGEGAGICYTRTGRRFFEDSSLEAEFLDAVSNAVTRAGFWEEFCTDWVCLDCELMPWSVKAQGLLKDDYAAVGAASSIALEEAVSVLEKASARGAEVQEVLESFQTRRELSARFVESYRRYCWPVRSLSDLKLAPFHLLATEGAVHTDKDHLWHLDIAARLCQAGEGRFSQTRYTIVELGIPPSEQAAVAWWEELTESGGEGMVVKSLDFITKGRRGLVQPAVKCRGAEYLRIIYGPEYTLPYNLERLRQRSVGTKRSLALREFALGIEGLERFVQKEPLRRVHECVLGVLGLESEPVDPRL